MEPLAGFFIAMAISLTGIGAGSLTAPVLMLFFHQQAAQAVSLALVFGSAVKLLAAPVYIWRRQVDYRVLGYMALGGLPGVMLGSLLMYSLDKAAMNGPVLALVGATVLISATISLFRPQRAPVVGTPDKRKWLPFIMAPIGVEVGFSSAGAGALGVVSLMHFTDLAPARIVGTDLLFGLALSLIGGGMHVGLTGLNTDLLFKLLIGGIPGALIGSQLAAVLPARKLRMALCVWLLYLGAQLLQKGFGPLHTMMISWQR